MPFDEIDSTTGEMVYGVNPYTFEQSLDIINNAVLANIIEETDGEVTSIDTSSQSALGKINIEIANHITTLYSELMEIQESFYLDTAIGNSLNKLALLVGFKKESATYSSGELRCFGDDGTIISSESLFSSLKGDEFYNEDAYEIDSSKCLSSMVRVLLEKDNKEYYISIDTRKYSVTSTTSSTYFSILSQLYSSLQEEQLITTTISSDLGKDSYLNITKISQEVTIKLSSSALLELYNIEIEIPVVAVESGVIFGDADTIVNISSSISGLESINNPLDFLIGVDDETDDELKARIKDSFNTVGSGTKDTIGAIIEGLEYVRDVKITANRTFEIDDNFLPPKTYELVISHEGDDTVLAEKIWETRPLGLDTYGQTVINITDIYNATQEVRFTNAEILYLHVKVNITKLAESEGEVYPTEGDALIKDAITSQGNAYHIDEDVIGKRFYGAIFDSVDGIATVDVQVFADTAPYTDQSSITGWVYKEEIGRTQISSFGTNRVFINDLTV